MDLPEDSVGAFTIRRARGGGEGPLAGLDWAVKDLFDVAGDTTGFGSPDWRRTHAPAVATAPVVQTLLAAGARLVGRTKTVELAFGLTGENPWDGTPLNPRTPDRFPGGSSCGSAAATAARLVDFALGSDTGGSVRIPASYCGLYGLRPTHGAISLAGACPLAPSFDTPGWFTREAALLERIGDVLLPGSNAPATGPLLRVEEAWLGAHPSVAAALAPALERLAPAFGRALGISVLPEGLTATYEAFRALQAEEAWTSLGGWVSAVQPRLSPAVAGRLAAARDIPAEAVRNGTALRRRLQTRLRPLLAGGAVLAFPTSPCPAPLLSAPEETQQQIREATLGVTAIAGLCGLPEVTLPAGTVAGAPVGLSLVGGVGSDRALLTLAKRVAGVLALP
ncbi:Amidase [Rhodovastum atsumiense]|uniref:Amidase n=1 Tax=Rhodovastum atsumiense TaxID=504468 RepID=A0A5M6INH3_9PROT|nr:amidase [Rhodovastum atsumiense]KAA5609801.1 amidase [Rhodovastum atsumiense]CAH2599414.1 Amidase [Rhodovastum atsumiense]